MAIKTKEPAMAVLSEIAERLRARPITPTAKTNEIQQGTTSAAQTCSFLSRGMLWTRTLKPSGWKDSFSGLFTGHQAFVCGCSLSTPQKFMNC